MQRIPPIPPIWRNWYRIRIRHHRMLKKRTRPRKLTPKTSMKRIILIRNPSSPKEMRREPTLPRPPLPSNSEAATGGLGNLKQREAEENLNRAPGLSPRPVAPARCDRGCSKLEQSHAASAVSRRRATVPDVPAPLQGGLVPRHAGRANGGSAATSQFTTLPAKLELR